jgi:hypothetical protein
MELRESEKEKENHNIAYHRCEGRGYTNVY